MSKPTIAQTSPCIVDVEPGTYYWCSCGKSTKQPFCDGSHEGSGFKPVEITVDKPKSLFLCGCKHTQHPPFCDGSHGEL